ncbi:MAG: TraB/GumN family protein [Deltaproteobacteria bacterium]|nr:TraB/GumN family protein [Deltaproteobacteria bacterium]
MRALALVKLGLAATTVACAGTAITPSAGTDLDLESAGPSRESQPAPLLWKVRAPGGKTSFLLGTIHVGVAATELSPAVWNALDASELFIMEADVAAASEQATSRGRPALEVLDRGDWQHLVELVGAERARALATVTVDRLYGAVLQALYPRVEVSMDLALAGAADSRGLQPRFLEDWRWQIELGQRYFDDGEVSEVLDPEGAGRRELDELVASYRRGDIESLARMALDPRAIAESPTRYRELFFDRNRAWSERLEPWLDEHPCFVAVGVGHLPGKRGLLELLRQRGFAAERVR